MLHLSSKVPLNPRYPCFVTDALLNSHPIQGDVRVGNAPITLHGYGTFDMKEIHLLKGDKSLSIKNSVGGYLRLSLTLFITDILCSAEGTGGTLLQNTAGSMYSFM